MANIKSAIKKIRKDKVRVARNKAWRSKVKTLVKKTDQLLAQKGIASDKLDQVFKEAQKNLDKAAKKRIIHPNKAARLKSHLAKKISEVSAAHESSKPRSS